MKKILIIFSLSLFTVTQLKAQTNTFPTSGNVGIGTTNTSNGVLTINGNATNSLRLENDVLNKESSMRFRSKSSNGGTLHSDISLYATGNNQGYLGFKVPHNNTVNSGYDMIINHSGYVGIGTTNPGSKLDVTGDIRLNGITADASNTKRNSFSLLLKSSGYASDNRARFQYWTVQSVSRSEWGSGDLTFLSNTDGAGNNEVVRFRNDGNVGIGTSAPDAKLAVKGNIHTNEVKVDLLGAVAPDYVFYKDYDLKTLNEVESYITKEGHLPNIPSAKEMETNGLLLKEMNLKLLEKIEELTLYTINQEKRINTLEQENNVFKKQQKRIKLLEEQMALLLKIKE